MKHNELHSLPFLDRLLNGEKVEWKTLGEVCDFVNGFAFKSGLFTDNGERIIRIKNINGKTIDLEDVKYFQKSDYKTDLNQFIVKKNDILIAMSGATTGKIGFYDYDKVSYINQRVGKFIPNEKALLSRYLYHILLYNTNKLYTLAGGGAQPNLSSTKLMESFPIPLPPLSVQSELVRILDKFTELEAELEAELDCRKRQYAYYREKILSFDTLNRGGYELKNVSFIPLGMIGKICMCKRILKHQTSDTGDIPFFKIGTFGKKPDAFISNELFEEYKTKYSYPKIGEILISASGTIGRSVIFQGENAYFQDSNIVWIENNENIVLNKYLYYCYQVIKWKVAEGGTIKRLYNDIIQKTLIPIPYFEDREKSIREQLRIVEILDKFDTLVNSISEGLPKEIKLRRKQYEYYRNQLLCFRHE